MAKDCAIAASQPVRNGRDLGADLIQLLSRFFIHYLDRRREAGREEYRTYDQLSAPTLP